MMSLKVRNCLQEKSGVVAEESKTSVAFVAKKPTNFPGLMVVIDSESHFPVNSGVLFATADFAAASLDFQHRAVLFGRNPVRVFETLVSVVLLLVC